METGIALLVPERTKTVDAHDRIFSVVSMIRHRRKCSFGYTYIYPEHPTSRFIAEYRAL